MTEIRPLILITNDDSISAPGLFKLVEALPENVDIIVVAPELPQSGKSSAITVNAPLRIAQHPDVGNARVFTVSGTPVDCVKLALHAIVPRRPDLVLSGINHGSNSGCNVIYSGTMGAVMEGCTVGIPSCGFSLLHHSMAADFDLSLPFVRRIIAVLLESPLPTGVCLNVNIPARVVPKGVRTCRAAKGYWTDEYQRYMDPSSKPFYWLTGTFVNSEPQATDTDEYWLNNEYISVVPVCVDMTDGNQVAPLSKLFDQ